MAGAIVAELNARFHNASASNDVREIGIFMRGLDTLSDYKRPWLPCPAEEAHCGTLRDRFSTSLVYPGQSTVYTPLGFVVHPDAVSVNCGYIDDGGSMHERCQPPRRSDTCTQPRACPPLSSQATPKNCSYGPSRLQEMVLARNANNRHGHVIRAYQEVVLDAATWVAHLPHTIMAFFLEASSRPTRKWAQALQSLHGMHAAFLSMYGRTASDVPVVLFDAKHAERAPFRELNPHALEELLASSARLLQRKPLPAHISRHLKPRVNV
jgi:hypothetical protein